MKIEISNGRVIDPKHGVDRVASLYLAAGRIAARGQRAGRLARESGGRRARARRLPGADRPFGAAARARLRVQGHARIGNGCRRRRWRDEPRLPARHRSSARRAGPGRDAEAPRPLAQPGARLSGRRADRRPQGRRAHRDGRARRGRMRRLLAGRAAADGYGGAAARDAVRGDVRPSRVAARRRTRISREAASRTTARSRRASACPRFPRRRRRSRWRRSSRWSAAPACASTCAGSRRPRASRWCARRSGTGCR